MKVIIAGSRNFNNYNMLKDYIDNLNLNIDEIISGAAKGADTLGEKYALENNIRIRRFYADWNAYGRAAGPIRNKKMADYGDCLIVFWDGESRGTYSMINFAKQLGLEIHICEYKKQQ